MLTFRGGAGLDTQVNPGHKDCSRCGGRAGCLQGCTSSNNPCTDFSSCTTPRTEQQCTTSPVDVWCSAQQSHQHKTLNAVMIIPSSTTCDTATSDQTNTAYSLGPRSKKGGTVATATFSITAAGSYIPCYSLHDGPYATAAELATHKWQQVGSCSFIVHGLAPSDFNITNGQSVAGSSVDITFYDGLRLNLTEGGDAVKFIKTGQTCASSAGPLEDRDLGSDPNDPTKAKVMAITFTLAGTYMACYRLYKSEAYQQVDLFLY